MSLVRIYASKMYRSSKHKDEIRAALQDPVNSELVQQLRSYLDKDTVASVAEKHEASAVTDNTDGVRDHEVDDVPEHSGGSTFGPAPKGGSTSDFSDNMFFEDNGADTEVNTDESESDVEDAKEATSDEDVTFSTKVSGESVNSATALYSQPVEMSDVNSISDQLDSIKGLLNSREDTQGVVRIVFKAPAELWIHYSDDTNLNTVMEQVIALLNSADYSVLDFNRLARTENAIVFTIAQSTKAVEPVEVKEAANE